MKEKRFKLEGVRNALDAGDSEFRRDKFRAAEIYRTALESLGVTDEVISARDLRAVDGLIPQQISRRVTKAMGDVGITQRRESSRSRDEGSRRVALGYLYYSCNRGVDWDWNLLNLGTACIPYDPRSGDVATVDADAEVGEKAFWRVLEKHGISDRHITGEAPLGGLRVDERDTANILWALRDL